MDGIADIIPPAPTHDGLAALLAPAADSGAWLLLAFILLVTLLCAIVMRHRLFARLRLWQAMRALRADKPVPEMAAQIEQLLRKHQRMHILHPEQAPQNVDAATWQASIKLLHAARFSARPVDLSPISPLLAGCFAPSPQAREGWGEGALGHVARHPEQASPAKKQRGIHPHEQDGTRA